MNVGGALQDGPRVGLVLTKDQPHVTRVRQQAHALEDGRGQLPPSGLEAARDRPRHVRVAPHLRAESHGHRLERDIVVRRPEAAARQHDVKRAPEPLELGDNLVELIGHDAHL